jgi:hypothetical protein
MSLSLNENTENLLMNREPSIVEDIGVWIR